MLLCNIAGHPCPSCSCFVAHTARAVGPFQTYRRSPRGCFSFVPTSFHHHQHTSKPWFRRMESALLQVERALRVVFYLNSKLQGCRRVHPFAPSGTMEKCPAGSVRSNLRQVNNRSGFDCRLRTVSHPLTQPSRVCDVLPALSDVDIMCWAQPLRSRRR